MSKSLGNSFLPADLVTGNHDLLDKAYSPMTVRFFMLQSHYSSTLDFSNEALTAAQKGYAKIANGLRLVKKMAFIEDEGELNEKTTKQINQICDNCTYAMNDDFNTALTIGHLFNLLKKINSLHTKALKFAEIGEETFNRMIETFKTFTTDILGLEEEEKIDSSSLIDVLIKLYKEAKEAKNYDKVDEIRAEMKSRGLVLKDMKDQIDWAYEE